MSLSHLCGNQAVTGDRSFLFGFAAAGICWGVQIVLVCPNSTKRGLSNGALGSPATSPQLQRSHLAPAPSVTFLPVKGLTWKIKRNKPNCYDEALSNFPRNWFHIFALIKAQKSVKGCWDRELPGCDATARTPPSVTARRGSCSPKSSWGSRCPPSSSSLGGRGSAKSVTRTVPSSPHQELPIPSHPPMSPQRGEWDRGLGQLCLGTGLLRGSWGGRDPGEQRDHRRIGAEGTSRDFKVKPQPEEAGNTPSAKHRVQDMEALGSGSRPHSAPGVPTPSPPGAPPAQLPPL